jgi:structure-specific recognition protein 1
MAGFTPAAAKTVHKLVRIDTSARETFDSIYLDLSKQAGKCRFAESGLGWKPSGGGDTFTLDKAEILSAQWGKAAKGNEVKIHSRNTGVIQLDGFHEDVRHHDCPSHRCLADRIGL